MSKREPLFSMILQSSESQILQPSIINNIWEFLLLWWNTMSKKKKTWSEERICLVFFFVCLFLSFIFCSVLKIYLSYVCEYTVFRHTRRGHQNPLQMVVSHHVVAGNWTQDSGCLVNALSHWAISIALERICFAYTSSSQSIVERSQDRSSSRVGTWQQELIDMDRCL